MNSDAAAAARTCRLRYRMATREDTTALVALVNRGFRSPVDSATCDWYAYGNPNGPSRIYLALEGEGGAIVGVIGFSPIKLRLRNEVVNGDYAHHLVLDPAYRDTFSYLGILRYSLNG